MCSYNKVDGQYSCSNSYILNDVLKGELGFQGFVQSDWWAVHEPSFLDGLDQEMPGKAPELFMSPSNTSKHPERVDEAVTRILSAMYKVNVPGTSSCSPPNCSDWFVRDVTGTSHRALATSLTTESIVMLKNDDELLPISNWAATGWKSCCFFICSTWAVSNIHFRIALPHETPRQDGEKDCHYWICGRLWVLWSGWCYSRPWNELVLWRLLFRTSAGCPPPLKKCKNPQCSGRFSHLLLHKLSGTANSQITQLPPTLLGVESADFSAGGGSGHLTGNVTTALQGLSARAALEGVEIIASPSDNLTAAQEAARPHHWLFIPFQSISYHKLGGI